jgi:uncharacterized protein YcbK (DUF882 family)
MNRRDFLIGASTFVVGASGLLIPDVAAARTDDFWSKDRRLSLRRSQTGEATTLVFFENGRYEPEAYRKACYFLRDVVDRNSMASMDIGLLNLMFGLQEWARLAGVPNPQLSINSGFRTRRHNAALEGAARNSLHLSGQAADINIRGMEQEQVQRMAAYYKVGGVGLYNNFVHIDTGRVRYWRGA